MEDPAVPRIVSVGSRGAFRSRGAAPSLRRTPWCALAMLGIALALGGCLQDARNADQNFDFNNPNDPTPVAGSTGIVIAGIDYLNSTQTVYIVNSSGVAQNLNGWGLRNNNTLAVYTFGSFTLGIGAFVRVHPITGTDTTLDVYSGPAGPTSPSWLLTNTASLLNATGGVTSSCTVGSPTC
jgi:hypothetical protein